MPRYFFAVAPPEPIQGAIERFRTRWGNPHHNVEPHITVKPPFAWGDPPGPLLGALQAALAGLRPFPARLGAPGRFGAGVLFLTVDSPGLKPLHLSTAAALPVGPGPHEGDAYTPHLTLAVTRFGISSDGMDRMETEARAELTAFPAFDVTALRCYHRSENADRWETLCDLPLGPL